jgi:PKD repeat protein
MNRLLRNLTLGVVCSGLGLWLACDSATPTAPSGTILTITANPSQISLNGTSQITVIGRRPDGNPLNPGTEIFFSTSRGTINPTVTTVNDAGIASAVLRGDGRVGAATVTASISTTSGGGGGDEEDGEGGMTGSTTGIGSVSTSVQIGELASSVSLQATPSSVSVTPTGSGGSAQTVSLLALVRDSSGQPLADVPVNFQTDLGTLASGGSFRNTNSQGEARDTLTVSAEELNSISGDTFAVRVEASGGEMGVATASFSVRIDRPLIADFSIVISGLTVSFADESTGIPTSWQWTFGDGGTSAMQNPTYTYDEPGTYNVSLTVRNARGSDLATRPVTVGN